MNLWQLPVSVSLGGREYPHRSDFRDILKLLEVLGDEGRPAILRWYMALELFYREPIPTELEREAMDYISQFISCGDPGRPGPKLLDWRADAGVIVADVNAVAGREVRAEEYLHWWTFLSYFHGIREGQLSTLVGIRDKLRRGKKLDDWEQDYYRRNKARVTLRQPESARDRETKQALLRMMEQGPAQAESAARDQASGIGAVNDRLAHQSRRGRCPHRP